MPAGMFTRLTDGDLPDSGKRWPSDHGNGRVFVITSCTGKFSTTSVPLTGSTALSVEHTQKQRLNADLARVQLERLQEIKLR